jgi:hypothetical protein
MADGYMSAVERANVAKQRRSELMTATDRCARAYQRVQRSPRLRKYESILMQDWGGRHWEWVTYSPVNEIEAWAQQIKEDTDGV